MNEEDTLLNASERRFFRKVAISLVIVYIALFAIPWLALLFPRVSYGRKLKEILGQLGTYGDMFGSLNCVLTGTALLGVIYTSILQRKQYSIAQDGLDEQRKQISLQQAELELQRKQIEKDDLDRRDAEEETRRVSLLTATSFLAQVYATEYTANKALHDNDYTFSTDFKAGKMVNHSAKTAVDPSSTLKGKYLATLELLERLQAHEGARFDKFLLDRIHEKVKEVATDSIGT